MSIVIINPDKTISLNGIKTFPVGLYQMCASDGDNFESCQATINKNTFKYGADVWHQSASIAGWQAQVNDLTSAGIWWEQTPYGTISTDWRTNNYFLGWRLEDEPDYAGTPISTVRSKYNEIKALDKNHPILLNIAGTEEDKYGNKYPSSLKTWAGIGDILSWDSYSHKYDENWIRADAIYAWEQISWQAAFEEYGGNPSNTFYNVNDVQQPVWTILQATMNWGYTLTAEELRTLTYTAITLDIKGIIYWSYKGYDDSGSGIINHPGLLNSIKAGNAVLNMYNAQEQELRSLNYVLVSPTVSFRWDAYKSSNDVSFGTTYLKKMWRLNPLDEEWRTNFNWILKKDETNGNYYLIVVNKGNKEVTSSVTISNQNLSGSKKVTFLGNMATGSGASTANNPSQILTAINGVFTDTFDAYAVHIYEIERGTTPLCPSLQIQISMSGAIPSLWTLDHTPKY